MNFATYLVIDTETTGLHPALVGLIEVAALALDDKLNIVDEFVMEIKPPEGKEIREDALKVNGFTRERIEQGADYEAFCKDFLEFIKKNFVKRPIAVGQFYPFDFAILDEVFCQSSYAEAAEELFLSNQFIDTKSLALTMNLKAQLAGKKIPFPVTSLSNKGGLKDTFGITGYEAHTALGDVKATREALIKLLELM